MIIFYMLFFLDKDITLIDIVCTGSKVKFISVIYAKNVKKNPLVIL